MQSLVLRSAESGDVSAIANVHLTAWREAYAPILLPKHFKWASEARTIRRTRQMLRDGTSTLVAERAGEIVGFIACGEPSEEEMNRPGAMEILHFFVHPDWSRKGIGAALLKEISVREAPEQIYAWVLTGVQAGPAFYRKHGFVADEATRCDFVFLDEALPMVRFCKLARQRTVPKRKK